MASTAFARPVRRYCLLFSCPVAVLLLAGGLLYAQAPNNKTLWVQAAERIEKHRKTDVTIRVVDTAGKPVVGARLTVRQTRHAFLFGSNIFKWGLAEEGSRRGRGTVEQQQAYRRYFAEVFNFATLPYYWSAYEPERGKPQHASRERVARWCRDHGIRTKGHPLAWNCSDPRWLPADVEQIRRLQMARIDDCVKHFRGLIDTWDVVNEATHFDRHDFVDRRAPKHSRMWQQVGRLEFARQCFEHARAANPGATLLINDYRKDPAYERVVEGLVDDGGKRLYDVIGIQSHMHGGAWANANIWEVCERFARFGVPLHFTETTILSGPQGWREARSGEWPSTPEGEARQAREVVRVYTMLFSHPAVEAVTWWDFSDFHSWKNAPAGFLRADMTPKPAYEELRNLVKKEWWTQAVLQSAGDGTATLRVFLGDYRVTVEVDGKEPAEHNFSARKRADSATWLVTVP